MEKKQEVNFKKSDINGSRLTVSFNSVKQYEQFKRYAAECGEDFTIYAKYKMTNKVILAFSQSIE